MKEWLIITLIIGLGLISFTITGFVVEEFTAPPEGVGPSEEEYNCMNSCVSEGCNANDMDCKRGNSEKCLTECNAGQPEAANEEESCMQECVIVGCGEIDFECQNGNKDRCENECGMIKAPEAQSIEQQCIIDCVAAVDPSIICGNSETGETGDEVCQRCAAECVHLYEGPCLNDEEVKSKQEACKTCEHCYGEPVMGDSGEGWECIVAIECKNASGEFGDEPGTGEGIVANVGEAISNAAESLVGFFKGLFTSEE